MSVCEYVGRFAELYDLFYADKPYQAEAAFLDRCLQRHGTGSGRRLLELACGTGRHAYALEEQGYEVVATDRSPDMIAQAQARGLDRDSQIRFLEADMRTLTLPGKPFDGILCLFDSIGYALTNEGILQVLARVRDHLRPGGLFLCEYWHSAAMLRHADPVRTRQWRTADAQVLRVSESSLDVHKQLCTVRFTVLALGHDGTYWRHEETHVNRYFSVPEMRLFLTTAGLVPLADYAGFADECRIDDAVWHVVTVAQKPPTGKH